MLDKNNWKLRTFRTEISGSCALSVSKQIKIK